ncbi:colanic acid capsular biosynthesis activation accesory protein RcsA [Klebsiella pneumoniae subsp. rhinoscleromatis]|nr:colanic acid capsular biosynthesis activation accesory protein RcsA [Klebsiella pneumoniae subsp. rhinoscleromatis]
MSTMIMDLCSYTRLGLTGYLTSRGIKKQEIVEVSSAADLQKHCTSCCPAVVFLNEDCFVHDDESNGIIRQIITQNPADAVCYLYVAGEHPF